MINSVNSALALCLEHFLFSSFPLQGNLYILCIPGARIGNEHLSPSSGISPSRHHKHGCTYYLILLLIFFFFLHPYAWSRVQAHGISVGIRPSVFCSIFLFDFQLCGVSFYTWYQITSAQRQFSSEAVFILTFSLFPFLLYHWIGLIDQFQFL